MEHDLIQQFAHSALKLALYPSFFGWISVLFLPPESPRILLYVMGPAIGFSLGNILVEKGFKRGGLPRRFASLAFCTLAGALGGFALAFPTALYCARRIKHSPRNVKPPRPMR